VLSEPVLRVLADRMGKHAAHQALYDATMAGIERGVGLEEALLADPEITKHVDGLDLTRCLDPRHALGAAPAFVDRVVATAHRGES
jgi:adenylosuccinate lyase